MKRATAVAGAAGLALALLAAGVQLSAPDDDARQSPFVQRAAPDRTAVGRDVAASVTGVHLARSVHSDLWSGSTTGVWVVVTARVSTVLTAGQPDAVLLLDGVRYDASDRPGTTALTGVVLEPGLPRAGAFLFELPRSAVSGRAARHAVVRIFAHRDPELDSAIEVTVDLAAHRAEPSFELERPVRVAP